MTSEQLVDCHGGCHCGSVRFKCKLPVNSTVFVCNCSICMKKQNNHVIIPQDNFVLIKGADHMTSYRFNTGKADHNFCNVCGVQSFYYPRSNPDGVGVMPHCLDQKDDGTSDVTFEYKQIDGQNWETAIMNNEEILTKSKK